MRLIDLNQFKTSHVSMNAMLGNTLSLTLLPKFKVVRNVQRIPFQMEEDSQLMGSSENGLKHYKKILN